MPDEPTVSSVRVDGNRPVGLALVRDAEALGAEPFFHEFIAGIERVLVPRGIPVLLQVVPTIAEACDRMTEWAGGGRVRGAILIDLLPGDERIELVRSLRLPTVVIGDPGTADGLPTVWTQDDVAMRDVVAQLRALGHTHLGHAAGPAHMAHTIIRRRTFREAVTELGGRLTEFDGDYSEASGRQVARALASLDDQPSVVVFDNDVMALAALAEASELGLEIPRDVSLVAWDDSALCQLAVPTVSAMSHDVQALGEAVGESLVAALDGHDPGAVTVPPAALVRRESLAYIDY